MIWGPFCFLAAILFSKFCQNLFRLSIQTSMQNLDSVAQEMSELCSILRFGGHFVFLAAILFFIFFQNLFGLSIQNLDSVAQDERVLLNFAIWRPFYFLAAILFFKKNQNLVRLSIRTSMRNLDSIAQEMSKLCSILWFGGHFVFQNFVKICSDCPYELPCKIWSLLLKKWASYGTWYERGQTSIYHLYSSDYTVQTSFLVFSKKKPK